MLRLEHHRRIATLLGQLKPELLRRHHCLFGGGTAIALRYGEFRQSVDVDLLVSDRQGYRELRQLIRRDNSLRALWKDPQHPLKENREPLTDQYGIRAHFHKRPPQGTWLAANRLRVLWSAMRHARHG